jgi:protocadherin alpha
VSSYSTQTQGTGNQINQTIIDVKLRADETYKFEVKVSPENKLPFQMLYMLDGSGSMNEQLEVTVNSSAKLLGRIMEEYSADSKFSLGMFTDKETAPFVNLNATWDSIKTNVPTLVLPYWRLLSSMTSDMKAFSDQIAEVKIPTFIDPDVDGEGHLDLLHRVFNCNDQLGFKETGKSRHLAFVATDNVFWVAGDGKFAGITEPVSAIENGKCKSMLQTASPSSYTRTYAVNALREDSVKYDYPSIGTLKKAIERARMYTVFQVKNSRYFSGPQKTHIQSVYKNLENALNGFVEFVPAQNSSTADELVNAAMKILDDISARVSLIANGADDFDISYTIKCPKTTNRTINVEERINDGKVVACNYMYKDQNDVATIEVSISRKNPENKKAITFYMDLPGVHQDNPLFKVNVVDLSVSCTNCNKDNNPTDCGTNGTPVCGVCECKPDIYGEKCDCSSPAKNEDSCKAKGDGADQVCNNDNGLCYCGNCECSENAFGVKFLGEFCQCDMSSCPQDGDGNPCGGRGSCNCVEGGPKCECKDPDIYDTAQDCRCKFPKFCIDPNTKTTCNKRSGGLCTCDGLCDCLDQFSGDFCEKCDNDECRRALCNEEDYKRVARDDYKAGNNDFVKVVGDYNPETDADKYYKCAAIVVSDQCLRSVSIDKSDHTRVWVGPEFCQKSIPAWIIVVIVGGIVLLLGAAVIVGWKVYVRMQEKREYAEFVKSQQNNQNATENPLHVSATKTVNMPVMSSK